MPRITRAALRSIEHQDGSDIAAAIPLPQTPIKDRVPLGETTGNKGARSEPASTSEEQAAPAKKGTGKGKKGNTAKKANKKTREKAEDADAGVLEDESQSMHSSAAEEARQDLLKDGSQGMLHITLAFDYSSKVVFDNDRSQIPPSAAVNTASQQLSPKPTTPYLDCEMHKPDDTTTSEGKDKQEDSFLSKIESRTPLRMTNGEGIDIPLKGESDKDDSFVEQTKARTPGKRVSRIEDSVEALDVLEEEIEKVGGLIPASADGLASPIKAKKQAKPQSTTADSDPSGPVRTKKSDISQKKVQIRRPSTAVGPAASNPSAEASNTRARPSTGLAQQKYDAATQAADSTHKRSQAISQASLKKRISSVHKAPFQSIKSTKPPTRPNFELPGEAVARKLKEQREERSKREEEDAAKPRVFKTRPLRRSHAPEVKLTATTKARLSMARGEPINSTRSSNGLNKSKPVPRPSLMAKASPDKRLSTLSIAKQSTPPTAGGPTRPSARHTRGPSFNDSVMMRAPSALGANRPAPTAEESAHQKLKGKEVFGRTKVEIAEREKVKREKEDAARKARADAAERGRIASRAWAEKQKARKLEAGKVNEQGKAGGA